MADIPPHVTELVDHLFRHQSGQVVATLCRIYGFGYLDQIEDVVQETLIKAMRQWPVSGVPDKPGAWLLTVARNQMRDALRHEKIVRDTTEVLGRQTEPSAAVEGFDVILDDQLEDDQLQLIFACCHPILGREAQVALTLKTLCGFSVGEIARAFLSQETTIAQRLVRAKRTIREANVRLAVPDATDLPIRLTAVLDVLYLMFNEGYNAHNGADVVRRDLCDEAIRLLRLLCRHPAGDAPQAHALLALMLLHGSRLPARTDSLGDIILLDAQDRRLWDRALISEGMRELARSATGDSISAYHIQAGIAACHATSTEAETNWAHILSLYEALLGINPSPVVALNHIVAQVMVRGTESGFAALDRVRAMSGMEQYYLLYATYGWLWERDGNASQARAYYTKARALTTVEAERRFLQRKIDATF